MEWPEEGGEACRGDWEEEVKETEGKSGEHIIVKSRKEWKGGGSGQLWQMLLADQRWWGQRQTHWVFYTEVAGDLDKRGFSSRGWTGEWTGSEDWSQGEQMTGSRSSVVKGKMIGSSSWREMWGHGKCIQNSTRCIMMEMTYVAGDSNGAGQQSNCRKLFV